MATALQKAAQSAVKAATAVGATETVTLRRYATTYVAATARGTESATDYSWTVVVEERSDRVEGGAKAYDRKITGAQSDLSVTPDPETDVVVLGGATYEIVDDGVTGDPGDATWTVELRR